MVVCLTSFSKGRRSAKRRWRGHSQSLTSSTPALPARARFATAEKALTAAEMHLYAAVARYRHGQLLDDKDLTAKAHAELVALGARNPERIAAMVAPG